jgi:glycine dehydrogenase subunit 2
MSDVRAEQVRAGQPTRAYARTREGTPEGNNTTPPTPPLGTPGEGPLQREQALTIFERGAPGRRAFACPTLDVPEVAPEQVLPEHLRRREPPRLPEVSEPEIVRHYVRLSKRNFDLDSGFYPLGSCTMKHNPRLHERVAALPGHARLHPLQDPERAQGALELMWNLERALTEIAGLPHVCLQPSAGSHGELAGVLLTRAFHEARGERRHKVLTPDTAHGTNPATVTMAGLQVVKLATNADGGIDLDDLRAKADTEVACLMLTNPNTLGVFDANIREIAEIVHEVGATLYYDGANLNAVMGMSRPGDMGFDIVHFNLHKSFTQPHGGGGPGAGPIAVSDRIAPFLPVPVIVRREGGEGAGGAGAGMGSRSAGAGSHAWFELDEQRPRSIGRLRGFQGNYGCFVRAYAYIRSLGAAGLRDASEVAVLNANYLLARLHRLGVTDLLPLAFPKAGAERSGPHPSPSPSSSGTREPRAGLCMHEFVLSGAPMKRELGLKTLDLAKRLLDYGYHPPTVYFPLLVEEALMVEPTETETRETLDAFAQAIAEILREAAEDPEIARNAPYTTPVRRLDEVGAAKRPVIRQAL